ncbi:MAG TPA: 2-amino-4-hydroxy-6-hydroxymethyldihydropteridine diphosphokinase, partial [Burkholderiales bacterium]|nr:2-amino-4-hydroxy-6-hydroxymethyldihydropteridine diphosphokinase [Burkholderiales bacterium]
ILLFGNAKIRTPALTLPHPRMHERAFVLKPLLEIAPELPFHSHLASCKDQKVERIG